MLCLHHFSDVARFRWFCRLPISNGIVWSRPFIYGMECHENARALDTPICTEAASCIQNVFQQKKQKNERKKKIDNFLGQQRCYSMLYGIAIFRRRKKRFYVLSYLSTHAHTHTHSHTHSHTHFKCYIS